MRSRTISLFPGISLAFLLAGCSAVFNPYKENFTCRGGSPGKCSSTPEIYSEAVGAGKTAAQVDPLLSSPKVVSITANESAYREAELAKAAKLLKQPVTPIIVPPAVMRVLILPYQGEGGELNMMRYAYIMSDKPKWIMGDYLVKQPEE